MDEYHVGAGSRSPETGHVQREIALHIDECDAAQNCRTTVPLPISSDRRPGAPIDPAFRILLQPRTDKASQKRVLMADLPLTITHSLAFALPCPVSRAVDYLGEPEILLGALPSVERVRERQPGSYRLTLAPIRMLGVVLRPAAEVTIVTAANRVRIASVDAEPHEIQGDEVPTRVDATLQLTPAATGCDARGALRLAAVIPERTIPPFMPRALAQRTAEGLLGLRLMQEAHAMARTLVAGFAAWDAEQPTGDYAPEATKDS
jgi:hypothetical protein